MFNFNSEGPGPNSANSAAPTAKRTSSAAPVLNSVSSMNLLAHQRQLHQHQHHQQQQRVKVPMPHQHQHQHHSTSSPSSSSSTFMPPLVANPLSVYKARKDRERVRVLDKYEIVGYIAAGTYGRVYKAKAKKNRPVSGSGVYAIKKFKADKEGEVVNYTGISQSACREMSLCRELNHRNITNLVETILEDKSIYMVFDYAEHDLLQIIHYHSHPERRALPESVFKSIMWQLLNGVSYLHQNWVLHRDLKPANIMVTSDGTVKIGDLGLARLFNDPLQSLFAGDKVVVTIWYRAPELLLGARHYTPAIDMWAVGCIFAELLSLRPIFKGEEAKMDKKNVPFQRNQTQKVMEILGTPHPSKWPSLPKYPEYSSLQTMKQYANVFEQWYHNIGRTNRNAFQLLCQLLEYDPSRRIAAHDALVHAYFTADKPAVSQNVFEGQKYEYPARRISVENIDIKASSFTAGVKRSAAAVSTDHDSGLNPRKKQK